MTASYNNSCNAPALGARLHSARKNEELTLVQLGLQTKINHSQISRIERGVFKGPSKNVRILCEFLKVDWKENAYANSAADLAMRLKRIASVSPKWEKAIVSFIEAMEVVQSDEAHQDR